MGVIILCLLFFNIYSDAFFWVGTGSKPSQEGAQVPDENGKVEPLRRYDTKTLVLTLPGDLTVFDVEWLSVWCKAYGIDFGHIRIPKNLNVPPSLKMLGVAPQVRIHSPQKKKEKIKKSVHILRLLLVFSCIILGNVHAC